jgi:hypothetical protein
LERPRAASREYTAGSLSNGASQSKRILHLADAASADDQEFVRWCFASITDADDFAQQFGGTLIPA